MLRWERMRTSSRSFAELVQYKHSVKLLPLVISEDQPVDVTLAKFSIRSMVPSGCNSIPVFNDAPYFVILYQFFDTGAVSSISSQIRCYIRIDFIIRRITARILLYGHVIL
jgi:hypothetical protein